MTDGPARGHFSHAQLVDAQGDPEPTALDDVGREGLGAVLKGVKVGLAHRITLGGIGYVLAGITVFVTIMGVMVVSDYTSGRSHLDGVTATVPAPLR